MSVGAWVGVGDDVEVSVSISVWVEVGVSVGVRVGVAVGVGDGEDVEVGEGVTVWVAVGIMVAGWCPERRAPSTSLLTFRAMASGRRVSAETAMTPSSPKPGV